jgi:uncharacterized protein DUF4404
MDHSEKLKATLAELHAELSAAGKVDPETRSLLREALAEIQDALSAAETSTPASIERSAAGGDGDDGLGQRLQTAAAKFEATHPTLAGLLKRLTDLLGAAGI